MTMKISERSRCRFNWKISFHPCRSMPHESTSLARLARNVPMPSTVSHEESEFRPKKMARHLVQPRRSSKVQRPTSTPPARCLRLGRPKGCSEGCGVIDPSWTQPR